MNLSVKIGFTVDAYDYQANMSLPDTSPTADAPFVFEVTRNPAAATTTTAGATTTTTPTSGATSDAGTILTVAVGGTGEVYLAVAPPVDIINKVADGLVNELQVIVAEGNFNGSIFTSAGAITGGGGTSSGATSGGGTSTGTASGQPDTSAP